MSFRFRTVRALGTLALLSCCALTGIAAGTAPADPRQAPSWGAIASMQRWYGYSFNHSSRATAELAARAQCERAASSSRSCVVRTYFDRSCGALAMGNFGEWGAATGSTATAAGRAAAGQCDGHLPTEPCKVMVSVCSPPAPVRGN